MHEESDLEKAVPVDQRTVDPGTTPQERIPAGVGGHDHEMAAIVGKVHTSERLTLLQRQIPHAGERSDQRRWYVSP